MTQDQFAAIARLLRLRPGPTTEGARMVLVDGLTITRAAHLAGCSRQSVGMTVGRCRAGLDLARRGAGFSDLKTRAVLSTG